MDIVTHADLVAVIDDRRARHRQQQPVHKFDAPAVALQQWREATTDAEVDARAAVARIGFPQIVALAIGDHFERQLVVVAQEDRPLAIRGNVRRLPHDVGDWETVFARDRHVHARHQREMERHMAFVAIAEIDLRVLRPLIGLGQHHAARRMRVHRGADGFQNLMRFREVFVVGPLALDEIGHGVEP